MEPCGMRRETSLTATKSPKFFRTRSSTTASGMSILAGRLEGAVLRSGAARKLCRRELERSRSPARRGKPLYVLEVGRGFILGGVGGIHGVQEPLAADRPGAHGHFPCAYPDMPGLLRQERAVPAAGLVVPGPDQHSVVNHDHPNRDETVRCPA